MRQRRDYCPCPTTVVHCWDVKRQVDLDSDTWQRVAAEFAAWGPSASDRAATMLRFGGVELGGIHFYFDKTCPRGER